MEERRCRVCGEPIHPERLELIPNTQTCTKHSTAQKKAGFMVPTAAKGTAPVLIFLPEDKESRRQAENAHLRKR
jgi:hypothetical protein